MIIIMQTQEKFCLCFTIINIDFFFFFGAPKLPLISRAYLSPKIKKLSVGYDELSSNASIMKFLAKSSLKLYEHFPSNAIRSHYTHSFLYHYFFTFLKIFY